MIAVALAGMTVSLLVVPVSALDALFVDRAELDDGLLRVEGEDAVPNAIVWVTSAESSASSPADDDGDFRVLAPNFRSSNCQVTVTDGATSAQVSLDECTPTDATADHATADDVNHHDGADDDAAADDHDLDDNHDNDAAADDHHDLDHDDHDDHHVDARPQRRCRRRRPRRCHQTL